MAVFGAIGPFFRPRDDFMINVDGVVAAGTRVDPQHFFGVTYSQLADRDLPAVGERDRQCLVYHLHIVPDAEFVARVVNVVPIAFLWFQSSPGRAELIPPYCHQVLHFKVDFV